MEILKKIDDLLIGWGISPSRADMFDQFIAFALILAVAFLADALCRKILLKVVAQLVKKTKATWDDIVFDRKVMVHLSRMVAPVIIYLFVPLAFVEVGSSAMDFIRRICLIYIIITFLSFVNSFLKAVYSVYSEKEQFRDRPLKGMLQTMQVILWLVGGIVVVGELIGRDPLSLLAGLGASAAILMLVFKDSIMGFVSGVQLSANDMLKVGDWIEMPKYGANGTVIEVTLNTVKSAQLGQYHYHHPSLPACQRLLPELARHARERWAASEAQYQYRHDQRPFLHPGDAGKISQDTATERLCGADGGSD